MNNQRTVAVVIALLLSAMVAHAQTYIFGRADFPVGTSANSVAMGDFNGDGVIDLAVVNEADNTVSVLLGKSDGTFAPQVTYATGLGPLAIVTGDFNGDGNLDLAVTNGGCILSRDLTLQCDGSTVSILLGNGDGSFRPHFEYATGNHPSSVAAGDFNGDGKLDLAITSTQGGGVFVLLGNGNGTFQTPLQYAAAGSQSAIVADSVIVADFNGDGKLDLAVGGSPVSGSGVSVLLGNGDGTFQAPLNAPGGAPLAAADFNLDGKLDLFAGGDVLLGNGDGTFVLYATYPSGSAAAAADLNGDGKPDLVVAQGGNPESNLRIDSVAVLLGNGDGTFQPATLYGTAPAPLICLLLISMVTGSSIWQWPILAAVSLVVQCREQFPFCSVLATAPSSGERIIRLERFLSKSSPPILMETANLILRQKAEEVS